ncbi:MAG TPA: FIST C-terminal domain-containing protein [Polyangiaceae bacterium]
MTTARSFSIREDNPTRFARGALEAFRRAPTTRGGLLFLGGTLADHVEAIGAAIGRAALGFPVLVGTGAGVLSERGELEGCSAGTGLSLGSGDADVLVADGPGTESASVRLAEELGAVCPSGRSTALVLARAQGFDLDSLEPLAGVKGVTIVGGGTPGDTPIVAVDRAGRVSRGRFGAFVVRKLAPARVRVSSACRLLMPLSPITEARGSAVLRIDGEPALEVLRGAAAGLEGQPLVLAVLASPAPFSAATDDSETRDELLVRGIQGVDPSRGAIVVSEEARVGRRMAFAVRDPAAARTDLEAASRELERDIAGAQPLFGIYVSCAGRGMSLYGSADVDIRIVRARFPETPFVGLHSAFEIAPCEGRPAVQLYTGVLAVFCAPS